MAKRRSMFKTISTTKLENLGATGGWNTVASLEKQQASFKSAYIDKVRVSYIVEGDSAGAFNANFGTLWVVTTSGTILSATDADNTGLILTASASRQGGGVITLPVKRRIVDNDFDTNSGENALSIQCRATDIGSASVNITMVIETWGRWHRVTPT